MRTINARNINEAFHLGMLMFNDYRNIDYGDIVKQSSRNGEVLKYSSPVLIEYRNPNERVLFHPQRNANPFFHFFESLWMLSGSEDLGFLKQYNKQMEAYSDDGKKLNGAYGYRWRYKFDRDQISEVISILKTNPNDRRAVIQMWCIDDLGSKSLDVPCNTHIYFSIDLGSKSLEDKLNMTVCNRSNDMLWGAFGANVVHFSILQEYIASMIGVKLGSYYQFSNNFHVYTKIFNKLQKEINEQKGQGFITEEYDLGEVKPMPLVNDPDSFLKDLQEFMSKPPEKVKLSLYKNKVFSDIAEPMYLSWICWKNNNIEGALIYAKNIKASDWKKACIDWFERKKTKV